MFFLTLQRSLSGFARTSRYGSSDKNHSAITVLLREGGSRGVCTPKVPKHSPLLPKAP